jgi:hypothetical protein
LLKILFFLTIAPPPPPPVSPGQLLNEQLFNQGYFRYLMTFQTHYPPAGSARKNCRIPGVVHMSLMSNSGILAVKLCMAYEAYMIGIVAMTFPLLMHYSPLA